MSEASAEIGDGEYGPFVKVSFLLAVLEAYRVDIGIGEY